LVEGQPVFVNVQTANLKRPPGNAPPGRWGLIGQAGDVSDMPLGRIETMPTGRRHGVALFSVFAAPTAAFMRSSRCCDSRYLS
jgi:hypothetical protein